jgi:hypothetical protein
VASPSLRLQASELGSRGGGAVALEPGPHLRCSQRAKDRSVEIAEITRAETSERARLLRVDSYSVTLDLTRGSEVFGSRSVISFSCADPGAASHADLVAHTVHEISLNGTRIDPASASGRGRIVLSGLAQQNELTVVADCRYSRDGTGLHRAVDPADGKVYTYTKFEPAYARSVYANFERVVVAMPVSAMACRADSTARALSRATGTDPSRLVM